MNDDIIYIQYEHLKLKEKYFKIKECLSRCGNSVIELNKEKEILNLFFSFSNIVKSLNLYICIF